MQEKNQMDIQREWGGEMSERSTFVFDGENFVPVRIEIGERPVNDEKKSERVFSYLVREFMRLPINIEGVLSEWIVFYFEKWVDKQLVTDSCTAIYGKVNALNYKERKQNFEAQTKILETDDYYELWARKVVGKPTLYRNFTIEDCKRIAKNPNWWKKRIRG